jgi:LysM repeat protein
MMQSVYKQQSLKDQQTISDLRRELDAAQGELKRVEAIKTASESKLSEALRRNEQQREELSRAKDERTQLASQQTTQITPIIRQLTEELARVREDRTQFAQTIKQLVQHMGELEGLKQTLAEAAKDPPAQSVETALNKQGEALAALQASLQGIQESLVEAQRQAQQKAQAEVSPAPTSGKRKTTSVPKDIPAAPKDHATGPKQQPNAQKDKPAAPKDAFAAGPTRTITVKAGDTLNSLAEKHGVTPAQLKETNRLTTDDIQVGQSLTVPAVNKPNVP